MSPASTRLESRVRSVRHHIRGRLIRIVSLWVAGVLALLFAGAFLLSGPEGWRQGSDAPFLLDLLTAAVAVAAFLLVRRLSRSWLSETRVARAMEGAAGVRPGVLRGSLELTRKTPEGVSGALAQRAVVGVLRDLEGRGDRALSGELASSLATWRRRGLALAGAGAVLVAALVISSPSRASATLAGLASPVATLVDPVLPALVVAPGSVEVQRGADVDVEISAAGRDVVELVHQSAGDIVRVERLAVEEGRARHVFESVAAAIEYRVRDVEGNQTPTYVLTPVDPLFVSDLTIYVTYPPHTGLPPDEYRGDPPPLRLPAGSSLRFEGRTSRPLASVALVDSAGADVAAFDVDGSTFGGRWRPRRSTVAEWRFRDRSGGPAEIQPEPVEVRLVPDAVPVIRISTPGRDTVMPLNLRQPLAIEAGDDYGLRRVELVAYRVTSIGEREEPVAQGFDVGGQRAVLARPLLDLRSWGLLPGDTVRYFARAVDNAPSGQVAVSREYALRMPEAAEVRREAEDAFEGAADRLQELAEEAGRQATENRERAMEAAVRRGSEQASRDAQADFEEREELASRLEEQAAMSAELDSLAAEMEALERMMEEAGQADPELRRQLSELQEMLDRMTGDELEQRMEELAEALSREDLERANRSLESMAGEQESFRERLEEALERFRRAALEQDFRATTSEVEEVARQEQALADAMTEADAPELRADQQEELARETEALEERMEALRERLSEMGEDEVAGGVEQAREQASLAREQMQEAGRRSRQGQTAEAGQEAQEAADRMEDVAREMQEAMERMAQDRMQAQQEALLRTADDALTLARRQGDLRERMRGAGQEELAAMRAQEASLLRGVENMAENLQRASDGAMGANREIAAQMGLAMESLQNTIEAMEGRRGATPAPAAQAEQAVADLNQLALMAVAGAQQMGQQGQGQSGEEVAQQLEELAQQQGDLMNQSTQLMPMQLGQQAMSEQLQQMSQGQESVASNLGDLADEPGSEQSLGDLQQLAQEAEALARELEQGRLTPEVVRRQERLFHRLLDAGRSLEREEFSEERESETPGAFERGRILSLTGAQLGIMPYEVPDGEQLQRLSPAVRQLVLDYFERLNRTTPRGGRGS